MSIRGVIFDLDGTLLNTLGDIAGAANDILQDRGLPIHPVPQYRDWIGDGVAMLFRRVLPPDAVTDAFVAECEAAFPEAYTRRGDAETKMYPGIDVMLSELSRREVQLAVLSNKPHKFTGRCVQRFLNAWSFRAVYGQRDDVPRKPHPAGALQILDECDLDAEQCLYVGDTATDMETARSAGLRAVGVGWGFRPASELQAAGANDLITDPTQLVDLLR